MLNVNGYNIESKGVGSQKERVLHNYKYVFTFLYLLTKFNKKYLLINMHNCVCTICHTDNFKYNVHYL